MSEKINFPTFSYWRSCKGCNQGQGDSQYIEKAQQVWIDGDLLHGPFVLRICKRCGFRWPEAMTYV